MDDTSPSSPVYFWRETDPETGYLSQWYPCAFTDDEDPSIIYPTAEHYMMYHKALLFSDRAVAAQILTAAHPREVKALGRRVSNFSEETWRAQREAIVARGNLLKFTRPADPGDGRWRVAVVGGGGGGGGSSSSSSNGGSGSGGGAGEDATVTAGEAEEGRTKGEAGGGNGPPTRTIRELLLRTGDREIVEASPMDRIWGIGFGAARAGSVGRERWGLNLLGKALMAVRAQLRDAEGQADRGKELNPA